MVIFPFLVEERSQRDRARRRKKDEEEVVTRKAKWESAPAGRLMRARDRVGKQIACGTAKEKSTARR